MDLGKHVNDLVDAETIVHEERRNSRSLHLRSLQKCCRGPWRRKCAEVPIKYVDGINGYPWCGILVVDDECCYLIFACRGRGEWNGRVVWFEKSTTMGTNIDGFQCLDRKVREFRDDN